MSAIHIGPRSSQGHGGLAWRIALLGACILCAAAAGKTADATERSQDDNRTYIVQAATTEAATRSVERAGGKDEFAERILASRDLAANGNRPVKGDAFGHGTHITTIAASAAINEMERLP